jgi:hypothetical protein
VPALLSWISINLPNLKTVRIINNSFVNSNQLCLMHSLSLLLSVFEIQTLVRLFSFVRLWKKKKNGVEEEA